MKKTLILLFAVVAMAACKKEKAEPVTITKSITINTYLGTGGWTDSTNDSPVVHA